MKFMNKATFSKEKKMKGILVIILLCMVACVAVVMGVYSILRAKYFFVVIYALAFLLGVIYTVLKINMIMPTFIANDEEKPYMRYWNNGFFPFRTDRGVIGDVIPEKIKSSKITLQGIAKIYIGTGKFLSRTLSESKFAMKASKYKNKYAKAIKQTEFIHITLVSGKERYMPIDDYNYEVLAEIIKYIQKKNEKMQFTTANREIRKLVFDAEKNKEGKEEAK